MKRAAYHQLLHRKDKHQFIDLSLVVGFISMQLQISSGSNFRPMLYSHLTSTNLRFKWSEFVSPILPPKSILPVLPGLYLKIARSLLSAELHFRDGYFDCIRNSNCCRCRKSRTTDWLPELRRIATTIHVTTSAESRTSFESTLPWTRQTPTTVADSDSKLFFYCTSW